MPDIGFLLRVSRPRFWFYLFGPYIVGLAAGASASADLSSLKTLVLALYFLLPANLLIYGINDIFDHETDNFNQKKAEYETLVQRKEHKALFFAIVLLNLPFIAATLMLSPQLTLAFFAFLFLSVFYSAPPIRAKSIPFLDSAFNVLYVFPGVIGYQLLAGEWPPVVLIIAAGLWTAAMHAYSAIPDIAADNLAGVRTIATYCGPYLTLAICTALYASAAVLSISYLGFVSVSLGSAYVLLMIGSVWSYRSGRLFKLYRAFPIINVAAGFLLLWEIALEKFV